MNNIFNSRKNNLKIRIMLLNQCKLDKKVLNMIIPQGCSFLIDDLFLQKNIAIKKLDDLISCIDVEKQYIEVKTASSSSASSSLVRTASSNSNNSNTKEGLILLFAKMLECLDLKSDNDVDNMSKLIEKLSSNNSANKTATYSANSANSKTSNRQTEIKIASKSVKDSHYQIDISKDSILKNSNKIFMISCYARDSYLGRYLIKRNFYFTNDREEAADLAYDEIVTKMASLKDRYYSEVIDVPSVSSQIRIILDGVISEIKFEEDNISTTVKR